MHEFIELSLIPYYKENEMKIDFFTFDHLDIFLNQSKSSRFYYCFTGGGVTTVG